MADEGKGAERRGHLTHLAVDVIANPDPQARYVAIKQAALSPSAHRELWERYGQNVPSAANLQWELVRQRGFTEIGAEDFIREYRQTVAYAQLEASDRATELTVNEDDDPQAENDDAHTTRASARQAEPRDSSTGSRYLIRFSMGRPSLSRGDFPLSEEDCTAPALFRSVWFDHGLLDAVDREDVAAVV
jgi:hypothetical protein